MRVIEEHLSGIVQTARHVIAQGTRALFEDLRRPSNKDAQKYGAKHCNRKEDEIEWEEERQRDHATHGQHQARVKTLTWNPWRLHRNAACHVSVGHFQDTRAREV